MTGIVRARGRVAGSVTILISCLFFAGAVRAQTSAPLFQQDTTYDIEQYYGRGKNVSVLERPRPEYEAAGIQTGGFFLYPKVESGLSFSDNVFASASDAAPSIYPQSGPPKSDESFSLRPSIVAQSDWGRHGLRLQADIQNVDYFRYRTEDQLGYLLKADGLINIHGDSALNLGLSTAKQYEDRGNVYESSGTKRPVHYTTENAYVRGSYVQDRFRFGLTGDYSRFDYYNAAAVAGGIIPENTRNQGTWVGTGRLEYALSPDTAVFAQVDYGKTHYDISTVASPARDSQSTQVLGGVNFDLTSLARGEIGLGYVDRDYDYFAYRSLKGLAAALKVEYFPTQLMTVTLNVKRRPQDAAFESAGGFFQTSATGTVDYELRRNWIVSAAGGYESDDFQGASRTDSVWNGGIATRYFLSRHVGISGNVGYIDRDSSGAAPGPRYKTTRVGIALVFQL
jgi:hypothetical protein